MNDKKELKKDEEYREKQSEKASYIPTYFEWVNVEEQKEIVDKLEKISNVETSKDEVSK